jgi:6-phosphofructokinase 1
MPLQIYMPESGLALDQMADNVNQELNRSGRCVVVVSEGFNVGDLGVSRDSFGHVQYSASEITVMQVVVNFLNRRGLTVRGAARGQVYGTDQRATAVYASNVDLDEAFSVGQKAVEIAVTAGSGYMATILRKPGAIYGVTYEKVQLEVVANSERSFPKSWITESRVDVTDEFVNYARPLVGCDWVSIPLVDGRPRYARLRPVFAEKKCAAYVPQAHRS